MLSRIEIAHQKTLEARQAKTQRELSVHFSECYTVCKQAEGISYQCGIDAL
jgi:hypothetical protein